MVDWTEEQIKDYFDSTNCTLFDLSAITGYTVAELKRMLMS